MNCLDMLLFFQDSSASNILWRISFQSNYSAKTNLENSESTCYFTIMPSALFNYIFGIKTSKLSHFIPNNKIKVFIKMKTNFFNSSVFLQILEISKHAQTRSLLLHISLIILANFKFKSNCFVSTII